jgi:aminomethyltransferase
MVPFAGYDMPVQYEHGIIAEHRHTRSAAGLFDVSHMGQFLLSGERIASTLESLMPADLAGLGEHRQTYALLTNEDGGVRDDLIVTRWGPEQFLLVVNAACKDDDRHGSRQICSRPSASRYWRRRHFWRCRARARVPC